DVLAMLWVNRIEHESVLAKRRSERGLMSAHYVETGEQKPGVWSWSVVVERNRCRRDDHPPIRLNQKFTHVRRVGCRLEVRQRGDRLPVIGKLKAIADRVGEVPCPGDDNYISGRNDNGDGVSLLRIDLRGEPVKVTEGGVDGATGKKSTDARVRLRIGHVEIA